LDDWYSRNDEEYYQKLVDIAESQDSEKLLVKTLVPVFKKQK